MKTCDYVDCEVIVARDKEKVGGGQYCDRHIVVVLKAQIDTLKAFVREFIRTECWGYEPEIDGGSAQEVAENMGIVVASKATPQDVEALAEYEIEEGDPVYKWADWMKE